MINLFLVVLFSFMAVLIWADLLAWFSMWVMVNYLTNEWKMSPFHAAGIVNISEGTAAILSVVFAFFVDAFMGNYWMLLLSSVSYTIVSRFYVYDYTTLVSYVTV